MLFNSLHFILFFLIVVVLYFSLPHKYRWILLLLGSYYFYMSWNVYYIVLIIASTLVDYICGILIHKAVRKSTKRFFLALSLATNLSILLTFKYFNFFSQAFVDAVSTFALPLNPVTLKVLLPVGISFYTFQTLSYSIDVYWGKIKPEKHLGHFAVYVAFFPQLVAGPIERARNLLPQLRVRQEVNYHRIRIGLMLMIWGLFKKVLIADKLSPIVNTFYSNPTDFTGIPLIYATVLFAFQIYCDFSGYSDVAIGAAQVMGITLMQNFKRPYFARSIGEFWQRWHISLSTWFKEYVYIPLGGNRVPIKRWYVNILAVFVISGLWHGANWTFIIWGALHGCYYIIAYLTKGIRKKLGTLFGLYARPRLLAALEIVTIFSVVCYAWIFFAARSLTDALYIATHLHVNLLTQIKGIFTLTFEGITLGTQPTFLLFALIPIGIMLYVHYLQESSEKSVREMLVRFPTPVRWALYLIALLALIVFTGTDAAPFIYFQF